ncbi:MAG TPA: hypothetical protein VNE62_00465 [Actinomycetota bacterium]|nr:hypothetical protein [Actinomycetota bacterium]
MTAKSIFKRPKLALMLFGSAWVLIRKAMRKSAGSSSARTAGDTPPAKQPLRGEDLAEEASMDSFPASDPPSY